MLKNGVANNEFKFSAELKKKKKGKDNYYSSYQDYFSLCFLGHVIMPKTSVEVTTREDFIQRLESTW